jgi:hypothetical protein
MEGAIPLRAVPLAVECPECGSAAVVYSCDPHCCFNHVCANCRASFFLTTRLLGEAREEVGEWPAAGGRSDPTAPTAPCDRCGGLGVWSIAEEERGAGPDDRVRRGVCVDCGAMLAVEIAAEAP